MIIFRKEIIMPNYIEKKTEEMKGKTEKLMEKYERDRQEKLDILKKIEEIEKRQAMERQMLSQIHGI